MTMRALLAALLVACLAATPEAKGKKRIGPHHALDKELKLRRQECEGQAGASLAPHERENLILSCLSQECYQSMYGHDPLEEGEVDSARGRDYRSCCRAELRAERQRERASKGSAGPEAVPADDDGEDGDDEGEENEGQARVEGAASNAHEEEAVEEAAAVER